MKPLFSLLFLILILVVPGVTPAFADQAFKSFDTTMEGFMSRHGIPGGALAVVKDGRLVYARGYGVADRNTGEAVKATSLFRIASISKPFTAAALFTLLQKSGGRVNLDTRAFPLLSSESYPGIKAPSDPRLLKITLRQLLQHTAGWDRESSGDPMFRSREIAEEQGVQAPALQQAIIRHMLKQSLDFDPGARYCYSNFGYCVLGRIIEQLSGQSYEEYVKTKVLEPLGIKEMRTGRTLPAGRAPGEVCYYEKEPQLAPTVFPGRTGAEVLRPYGSYCIEAMDSHGGWLASPIDLARFAAVLDGSAGQRLLSADSRKAMYALPPAPAWRENGGRPSDYYYGCGWLIRPVGSSGKANYWHAGLLAGTYTLLVRRHDGLSWVALFNECTPENHADYGEIDLALHQGAAGVTRWPDHDLFSTYK
jgi:N-acyl-D-amino-acid deacylase